MALACLRPPRGRWALRLSLMLPGTIRTLPFRACLSATYRGRDPEEGEDSSPAITSTEARLQVTNERNSLGCR
jgi:hypothetical protein